MTWMNDIATEQQPIWKLMMFLWGCVHLSEFVCTLTIMSAHCAIARDIALLLLFVCDEFLRGTCHYRQFWKFILIIWLCWMDWKSCNSHSIGLWIKGHFNKMSTFACMCRASVDTNHLPHYLRSWMTFVNDQLQHFNGSRCWQIKEPVQLKKGWLMKKLMKFAKCYNIATMYRMTIEKIKLRTWMARMKIRHVQWNHVKWYSIRCTSAIIFVKSVQFITGHYALKLTLCSSSVCTGIKCLHMLWRFYCMNFIRRIRPFYVSFDVGQCDSSLFKSYFPEAQYAYAQTLLSTIEFNPDKQARRVHSLIYNSFNR